MNKFPVVLIAALTLAGLLLAACGGGKTSAGLTGVDWKLVSYGTKDSQTPAAADVETSLVFGTDGTISGSLGCNSFGGKYKVADGSIEFSEVISTMMACVEPRMTQESTSYQVLNGTATFELQDNTLTLTSESGDVVIILSGEPMK